MAEVTDSYQEYVRARREANQLDKIATLVLPASQMASIGAVIAEAVDNVPEPLPLDIRRKWESILRSITSAVRDAE